MAGSCVAGLHHMRATYELNRVAPLVTDPPRANSPTRQNPPICNPPLYIATTSEQNMEFQNYLGIEMSRKDDIMSKRKDS